MQSKIPAKWPLAVLIGIVSIFFLAPHFLGQDFLAKFFSRTAEPAAGLVAGVSVEPVAVTAEWNSEFEFRLRIPGAGIDAGVESVGLTVDGNMDAPKGPVNAGWFNRGPRPGDIGSAVIDGHSGWFDGIPAIFDELSKLQKGDKVFVEDKAGAIMIFVVRELRVFDPDTSAAEVFASNDGRSHLNLITCEGVWDPVTASYSERLVVFTDKVEQ